jgi:hypothetical protein
MANRASYDPYLLYLDARTSYASQRMTRLDLERLKEKARLAKRATYRRYDGTELCLSGKTFNLEIVHCQAAVDVHSFMRRKEKRDDQTVLF